MADGGPLTSSSSEARPKLEIFEGLGMPCPSPVPDVSPVRVGAGTPGKWEAFGFKNNVLSPTS